ncbi:uncharacterized protein BO96DRAFT_415239 [Aspergillus niger CBS 101883]|nr:uncharacterized protein BO96DRAFT_415239 [Aspergillus niger CBS 101883]PYH52794.1 hypothetical protein BO96DRAFT_415239 [Aspergillus niger CBS 101883]
MVGVIGFLDIFVFHHEGVLGLATEGWLTAHEKAARSVACWRYLCLLPVLFAIPFHYASFLTKVDDRFMKGSRI